MECDTMISEFGLQVRSSCVFAWEDSSRFMRSELQRYVEKYGK